MIKIKTYPAKEGDALLVSADNENLNVLIDMGPADTYSKHIKKDLLKLNSYGKTIDLLVVTHVDNDHISGVLEFIKDNKENSNIIPVREVWHNSYRHMQFDRADYELDRDETNTLKQICSQNICSDDKHGLNDVAIDEGITLASLLYRYSYSWNESLKGKAIRNSPNFVDISSKAKIRIVSPNEKKLGKLEKKWKHKLESEKYDFTLNDDKIFDDAFELYIKNCEITSEINDISNNNENLAFKELINLKGRDGSVTNGSSIAFILEHKDNKLLFLGDAHEDNIYDELKSLEETGYELNFDLVKLSHHGSNNNISNRLLKLISCQKYLISTNGKYNHPNLATIAKIVSVNSDAEIITNYHHEKLDNFRSNLPDTSAKFNIITTNEFFIGQKNEN
ncbi:MBL fold metallo-hydrolase [Vibrio penaeicida]|uniref:MBL fold metallo-hydrolase n=1 Tax=Vibrio penaeicida TaxID=104609 RepID=UPI002735005F|nr:MBL fold metallo-hydrolase [Vibrio penaeicida]MDP2571840.1 MBL fold metallo-hydrolase [Vibrio penaeicida]